MSLLRDILGFSVSDIMKEKSIEKAPEWLEWQKKLLESESRRIIVVGGYGSGKSLASLRKFLDWTKEGGGESIFTSFSYNTGVKLLGQLMPELGVPFNLNTQRGFFEYEGNKIYIFGMDTIRSKMRIRSLSLRNWYADEIILQDFEAVREVFARLRKPAPRFIWATNPDRPSHWVKTEYIDKSDKRQIEVMTIDTRQNPHLPEDYEPLLYPQTSHHFRRMVLGEWVESGDAPFSIVEYAQEKPAGERWAVIDPSLKGNDFTAVAVGGIDMEDRAVIWGRLWKDSWNRALPEIVEYLDGEGVTRLFIEDNSVGNALRDVLYDSYAITSENFRSKKNKQEKILSLFPFISRKKLLIFDSHNSFIDQLRGWYPDTREHDDAPDSAAMLFFKMWGINGG